VGGGGHFVWYGLAAGHEAVVRASSGYSVHNRVVKGDVRCEVGEAGGGAGEERAHEALDFVSVAADVVEVDDAHALLRLRALQIRGQRELPTAVQE
jgi:hypothetical protein